MNRKEVLRRLKEDLDLPVLPQAMRRLDEELARPEVDLRRVEPLVRADPVLTGQVLRMANSAFYARNGGSTVSIGPAVARLGVRVLRGLLLAITLPRLVHSRSGGFDRRRFWRHSLAVAELGLRLARRTRCGVEPDEAFVTGLLHDLGAVLLGQFIGDAYGKALYAFQDRRNPSDEPLPADAPGWTVREVELWGIDHAETGAEFLSTRWGFPKGICDAVKHHHDPDAGGGVLAHLVGLADGMCDGMGYGWDPSTAARLPFRQSSWEAIQLGTDPPEDLFDEVRCSLGEAVELLRVSGEEDR